MDRVKLLQDLLDLFVEKGVQIEKVDMDIPVNMLRISGVFFGERVVVNVGFLEEGDTNAEKLG